MDLWSRGLGKMVLSVRLSERSEMGAEENAAVIRGTMGAPVFWRYTVHLGDEDVVDFIELLKQPAAVGFAVTSRQRWSILFAALHSAVAFAGAIARLSLSDILSGLRTTPPDAPTDSGGGDCNRQEEEGDAQHRP